MSGLYEREKRNVTKRMQCQTGRKCQCRYNIHLLSKEMVQ